jgi:hypothetical protein
MDGSRRAGRKMIGRGQKVTRMTTKLKVALAGIALAVVAATANAQPYYPQYYPGSGYPYPAYAYPPPVYGYPAYWGAPSYYAWAPPAYAVPYPFFSPYSAPYSARVGPNLNRLPHY